MIARYEAKSISKLWTDQSRFEYLLKVETALMEVLEIEGTVPAGAADVFKRAKINPDRISEIEATTKHDVIAFCTSITEQVDPKLGKYFHFGVTSSDVLDTALSLQVRDSILEVEKSLEATIQSLDRLCSRTEHLLTMGRSHGMSAEPMVFAQKFLGSRVEFQRRLVDYRLILKSEMTGQISGAVGNYTVLSPTIEAKVMQKLALQTETVSTQVIPRDRLAKIIATGALLASAIERLCVELRHLHHSDIGEISEGFSKGQKGSSTMPHKKNPVTGENLTGISRVIRSHVEISLQNIVLWHERDISHSSAERMILPDHFGLLVYALNRLSTTLDSLEIHEERIEGKVREGYRTLSSYILHQLIAKNDVPREKLYEVVQKASFQSTSLESMLASIEEGCAKNQWDGKLSVNWDSIKAVYFRNYSEVKKRAESI